MADDLSRNRAPETSFCVGNWYKNKVDPLRSGRFVREFGELAVLTRMGKEITVDKKNLEAVRELR